MGRANMWSPPDQGWLKFNVIGASNRLALYTETWGIMVGLEIARDTKINYLIMETDFMEAFRVITSDAANHPVLEYMINRIRQLLKMNSMVSLEHTFHEGN
ncbi:receptor-like kinase [Senna tora]|uniref:Receptor-like kinase n=1 Tax=Senna tora TaxID=362788 RepID=A0A834W2I1_9FABA|nr:receptor-like kinase [Senna tora]